MPVTYDFAVEVETIARRLIDQYHDHLADEEVFCIFRSEASKTAGRAVFGKADKIAGRAAFLFRRNQEFDAIPGEDSAALRSEPLFLLTVPRDIWSVLGPDQKEALIDHLLSHCRVEHSENGARLVVVPPDGEYPGVAQRHGAWRRGLVDLMGAMAEHQPSLFDAEQLAAMRKAAAPDPAPPPKAEAEKQSSEDEDDGEDLTDPDDQETETFEEEYARVHQIEDEQVARVKRAARSGGKAAQA